MELERSLGFRSSFNFIPEGDYRVSQELRRKLVSEGFEVGVHDLYHNGSLHRSREEFLTQASRINSYLKEWNATGFRAGFMRHNLEWQHELDITYDASTFDTDPFEPQPEGCHTIYPFWVPARRVVHSGYVELPYTLPQDSTLFLLFRESDATIWIRKLDWIARHGGMALLNVHPDYVRFPGESVSRRTYPVDYYRQFLEFVREHYLGTCWHALPRQVAEHVLSNRQPLTHRERRRVGIVAYTFYENDARVARYAKALSERGDEVDMFSLKSNPQAPSEEVREGVRIFRLQTRSSREKSKLSYLLPLLRFLAISSLRVARQHARHPYDLLHIHNVPDFLAFAAWRPKLSGAKVILDIHDIVPEFFGSKFGVPERSALVRLLKVMERASASFADHVIVSNHLWLDKYSKRAAGPQKCSAIINYVDGRIFYPRRRTRRDGKLVVLFPGTYQRHQGLDVAIRALAQLKGRLPQAELHLYGDGPSRTALVRLTCELGVEERVRFFEPRPLDQIAEVMANADLGVVPKLADSFGNEAYSTKIMEFMSLGVPVVVSRTRIDQYYFNEDVVRFFESGNPDALAEAMLDVLTKPDLRRRLVVNGMAFAKVNRWESQRGKYLKLVDSLCEGNGSFGTDTYEHATEASAPPHTVHSETPTLTDSAIPRRC